MSQNHPESSQSQHSGWILFAQLPVYSLLVMFFCLAVYCIFQRLPYPFEIDWIEGEMVCHALRMVNGQPTYPPPSSEFVSELYPPVYYLVTAVFFKLFATFNFLIPRIISVVCLAGVLWLIYLIPVKESGYKSIGLLISGFFLSCYEIHGPWYDLARVDMLFFFLILSGCYMLAYSHKKVWAALGSAVLLVFACYTKQSGLFFLPFVTLYLFFVDKKQCVIFSGAAFLLLVAVFFSLQQVSDGWFGTYVLFNPLRYNQVVTKPLSELPFRMLLEMRHKLFPEIRYEIFYKLPIFFTIVVAFVIQKACSITRKTKVTIWEFTAVAAVIAYFSIRPHPGSERNDFIYMTLWGCILLGQFLVKLSESSFNDVRNSKRVTVYLLLTLQLCLQIYNPKTLIPTQQDIKKGYEFISMVKNIPGEVYLPYHSFYGVMAGKKMMFNGGAYWAYQILTKEKFRPTDLMEKIKKKQISAIIADDKGYLTAKGERLVIDNMKMLFTSGDELAHVVEENYKIVKRIPYSSDDEFRNVTGFNTRPELILEPKTP